MRPFSTLLFLVLVLSFWGIGRIAYPDKYAFGATTAVSPDSMIAPHSPSLAASSSKGKTPALSGKKRILNFSKPFASIDKHARNAPKSAEKSVGKLLDYLLAPAKNDRERARAIFTWMADRMRYDDHGFNTGNYADTDAESVFHSRNAVCEGFANLFKMLCDSAGLECLKISGYAKGYGYAEGEKFEDTDHAWNAVKIEGKWRFMDVTWGEGFGSNVNGKLVSKKEFDETWFDVDPYAFIFTHLPESSAHQFLSNPINMASYVQMPWIRPGFFEMGFDSKTVLSKARKETLTVATHYPPDYPVKLKGAPFSRNIPSNQSFEIEITSDHYSFVWVKNGASEEHYEMDENGKARFTLKSNGSGPVKILIGEERWGSHNTLLEYEIGKSGIAANKVPI